MRPIHHPFRNTMMKTRLSKLTAALTVGALAGLSAPARAIDDTEIYFNPSGSVTSASKPNVLFILDNSGSMSTCFSGSGSSCTTRIQALQQAMSDVLNNNDVYNGINAGIMRFDGDDSDSEYIPIFYPIKPLTDDASTVDNGPTYGGGTKVRDRLLNIVNAMAPRGGTPIVGALYEAARYLTGSTVGFTIDGTGYYGVPHKGAVTGGSFQKCTTSRSGATTCSSTCDSGTTGSTRCTTTGTPAPTYISPLTADRGAPFTQDTKPDCAQADYVVLITDGLPTSSTSGLRTKVQTLTGQSSCATTSAGGTDGQCGSEVMHFMHGDYNVGDIRSGQTGKQWIIGHTVGLALDDPNGQTYLNELSAAGGGKSYAANNPAQLATALSEIVSNAINRSAALARPTITLNVFNPNYDRDDVYMTFFDPKGKSRWAGNVKKYKFCSTRDNPATTAVEGCTLEDGSTVSFGTLLGQGSSSTSYIKATGSNGELLLSAKDRWNTSGAPDGSNVRAGGAGAVLDAMTKSTRKLYTFAGSYESSSPYTRPVNSGASNPNLTVNDNLLSQGRASSSTTCSSSTSSVNCNLTPSLFGIAGTATSDYTTMNNILKWIRDPGLDVNDGNGNGSTTDYYDPTDDDDDNATNDALWPFEDPMHAGAVPFEYGGTSTAPITKLFVPTNGGGLRMLNSATGAEEWTWVPKELLSMQSTLMSSATVLPGGTRTYGLDMTPVLWVRDDNDNDATNGIYANAQIEPSNGDFVRLFIGQRDGGRSYYGLNVSPSADVSTSSSSVTVAPQLLWKIQGGVTTGFNTLKNTWSTPVLGKIRTASGSKIVLIFGGGNDTTLNAKYGTNQGTENDANIVYIVDATTGEKLYSFGGNGTDATLKVSGMNYPVPSEITAFDSNGDGYTDRLYFGDMGGNVWRADLYYDSSTNLLASVGKFADLSLTIPGQVAGTPAGKPASSVTTPQALNVNSRSFYYRPSVTSVSRADLGGRFDMVFLVSGQRNNPRNGQDGTATGNATVVNHLYAIQDLYIGAGKKAGDSAFPARKSGASGTGPLTFTDLIDMTANNYQMTRNATTGNLELSSTQRANLKTAYSTAAGWYLPLADVGEKGVSNTTVANDILVFNTYTPADLSASTNQCAVPNPGKGRIYAVDAFTGSAIFANFDSSGTNGSTNLTTSDRALIGTGMPVDGETTAMTTSGILGLNKFGDGTASNDNTGDSGTGLRSNPFGDGLPRGRIYWYER